MVMMKTLQMIVSLSSYGRSLGQFTLHSIALMLGWRQAKMTILRVAVLLDVEKSGQVLEAHEFYHKRPSVH